MKSVLITGASTGIGEACALHLAERGWQVFAGVRKDTDASRLSNVATGITSVILDVTNSKQIAATVKTIRSRVKNDGLQGLVNNAGIAVSGPLEFLPIDALRRQLEINFFAQVEVTQDLLPLLRTGRGRVVNMSSIGGRVVAPYLVPYSASKFALEAFTDGLRREMRPWKIHVASVQAGAIATPIWEKSFSQALDFRGQLPAEAEGLYGVGMDQMLAWSKRSAARGLPALAVARKVEHALTARWPRTRYIVGRGTRLAIWLARHLPDELVDWAIGTRLYR